MDRESLMALAANIATNGLVHPIVLHDRQILDGRTRLLACNAAKVEPRFVKWSDVYKGSMTLAQWIWSINVERRHLTVDQITAAKTALNAWEERETARHRRDEARRQQGEHGKEGGRGNKKALMTISSPRVSEGAAEGAAKEPAQTPQPRSPEAPNLNAGSVRKKIAKDVGTSEYRVQQALNIQKADPDLVTQVAHGKLTLREAARQVESEDPRTQGAAKVQTYDVKPAINRVVRLIKKVLASCPEEKRNTLLAEVTKALKKLRLPM